MMSRMFTSSAEGGIGKFAKFIFEKRYGSVKLLYNIAWGKRVFWLANTLDLFALRQYRVSKRGTSTNSVKYYALSYIFMLCKQKTIFYPSST